jgi:hypothetical protein
VDSKNTAPVLTPFYKQKVYLNKEDFKHPEFGNTPLISQVISISENWNRDSHLKITEFSSDE